MNHLTDEDIDLATSLGLQHDEVEEIASRVARRLTKTEWSIFSSLWSEHCSYKSSKIWLEALPCTGRHVICGPGENAGIIDVGSKKWAVAFKMESHNHPSFIEPFHGAATGVGGIMRDVFTMGARPFALLNALRFGSIDKAHTRYLIEGVVRGIGDYGNCVGIPTIGGDVAFDESYTENNIVNAMCIGVVAKDRIFYSKAAGVGNAVLYVGSKTGRDGINGASMASASFADETQSQKPTVQVGDPFAQKLLMEACLELMKQDYLICVQDMGAAGLTSSAVEMAQKGGVGISLDLDCVPLRDADMTAPEIMLSESQERMLMVVKKGCEEEVQAILDKWDVPSCVVGEIVRDRVILVQHKGVTQAHISLHALEAPKLMKPMELPKVTYDTSYLFPPERCGALEILKFMMKSEHLCSREWVYQQYDSTIKANTIVGPGLDAGVVRIPNLKNKALAVSVGCNPRYCAQDPREGAKQAVAQCFRNVSAKGARPIAITNCLNFGSPDDLTVMATFALSLQGMSEACLAFDTPIVSGNVSFYNATNDRPIAPTPMIGCVGVIDDLTAYSKRPQLRDGGIIVLLGKTEGDITQTLYSQIIESRFPDTRWNEGPIPPVNLDKEDQYGRFVQSIVKNGICALAHDVADGGVLVAIAQMALYADIGIKIRPERHLPLHVWCFSEDQGRYLLAFSQEGWEAFQVVVQAHPLSWSVVGLISGQSLEYEGQSVSLEELRHSWQTAMADLMAGKKP